MVNLYDEHGIVSVLPALSRDATPDSRTALLLLDGLGAHLLEHHRRSAPNLSAAWNAGGRHLLTSCFPSTTVTGMAAFGLGTPPGQHGLVGATFPHVDDDGRAGIFLPLRGCFLEDGRTGRLAIADGQVSPWARAEATCAVLTPSHLTWSPFQQQVFGACDRFGYADAKDLADGAAGALRDHQLVIVYVDWIDRVGHREGIAGAPMTAALAAADRLFVELRQRLPARGRLLCCGDHGLADVGRMIGPERLHPVRDSLAAVCGDLRCVHFWARPDGGERLAADLPAALPDATVWTRDAAIGMGLYGPRACDLARERIGDLVVTFADAGTALLWWPAFEWHRAHHGGLTDDERLVPLIAG